MIFVTRDDAIKKRACDFIMSLETVMDIRILKPNRTRAQNDYFWACATILGDAFGHSKDDIKDILMTALGFYDEKMLNGKVYTIVQTTTTLNKEEFGKLIDSAFIMAQEGKVVLPIAKMCGVV